MEDTLLKVLNIPIATSGNPLGEYTHINNIIGPAIGVGGTIYNLVTLKSTNFHHVAQSATHLRVCTRMDIVGEVLEMVPLVGTVLQKLMTISGKVEDGLNQKNDAKIVFVDMKRRIDQSEEVLTFLKPRLEGDDALCATRC